MTLKGAGSGKDAFEFHTGDHIGMGGIAVGLNWVGSKGVKPGASTIAPTSMVLSLGFME